MSDIRPPRWLKPMNKLLITVQRLGIPAGPSMVLTVPAVGPANPAARP